MVSIKFAANDALDVCDANNVMNILHFGVVPLLGVLCSLNWSASRCTSALDGVKSLLRKRFCSWPFFVGNLRPVSPQHLLASNWIRISKWEMMWAQHNQFRDGGGGDGTQPRHSGECRAKGKGKEEKTITNTNIIIFNFHVSHLIFVNIFTITANFHFIKFDERTAIMLHGGGWCVCVCYVCFFNRFCTF